MSTSKDIKKIYSTDDQWYKKIWGLEIQDMAWVEHTSAQIDFVWEVLELNGSEKILDLACGFGRHSVELARRGCQVVGVDITPAYIDEGQRRAVAESLDCEFICADLRDLNYTEEFDVVFNFADGAIGYLENDQENLKIFDVIARALKPGGKHVMDICNGGYAVKHFPRRHWLAGQHSLSLADFEWDADRSLMYYGGLEFKYGAVLPKLTEIHSNPTRLYNLGELNTIFTQRKMHLIQAYSEFDTQNLANDDTFQMQVYSQKNP